MGSLVDYDVHYAKGPKQCGEPFPEVVRFLEMQYRPQRSLLDLGCGQGRDAIVAAEMGYSVVGVDLSAVGLSQLARLANEKRLDIELHEGELATFRTRRRFHVVLLDRVLHLLLSDEERIEALTNALRLARKRAAIAVIDGPRHSPLIQSFFDQRAEWTPMKRTKRFLFATR